VPPWHPRHAAFAAAGAKRGSKGAARAQAREVAAKAQPRVAVQQANPPALGGRAWEYGAPSQQDPMPLPLPLPLSHRHQVGVDGGPVRFEQTSYNLVVVKAVLFSFHQDKALTRRSLCWQYQAAQHHTRGAVGHAECQITSLCRGRVSGDGRLGCPSRAATPAPSRGCPSGSSCRRPSTWPAYQGA
jgi:hypothetical protein